MRFVLGHESAAGWHVLDGRRMRAFYVNADGREDALAFVEALNVIEDTLVKRERNEAAARDQLVSALARIRGVT